LLANAQTVCFCPKNARWALPYRLIESKLLQPLLQIIPCHNAVGFITALRIGLIGTDKNMTLNLR